MNKSIAHLISPLRKKPADWQINLFSTWLSQLFALGGFSALIPFIPLFLKHQLGLEDPRDLVFYVTMFNVFGTLGSTIASPIWGSLSDKFGVRPMLLRGTFGSTIFYILMAYSTSPVMLIALRFLFAMCAGTTASSQMLLARTTPFNHRGLAFGILLSAIWSGSAFGNFVGGLIIHRYGYLFVFWMCGILHMLAGFAILPCRDGKIIKRASSKSSVKNAFYTFKFTWAVWIMMAVAVLVGLVRNVEVPYIALQVESLTSVKMAAYWTGIVNSEVCVGALVAGVVFGIIIDKYSPFVVLAIVMPLSAGALVFEGLAPSLMSFAVSRVLQFFFATGIPPLFNKVLTLSVPKRKRGAAFGFYSSFDSLGNALASSIAGMSFYLLGTSGVFLVAAGCSFVAWPLFYVCLKFVTKQPFYNTGK